MLENRTFQCPKSSSERDSVKPAVLSSRFDDPFAHPLNLLRLFAGDQQLERKCDTPVALADCNELELYFEPGSVSPAAPPALAAVSILRASGSLSATVTGSEALLSSSCLRVVSASSSLFSLTYCVT